MKNWNRDFLYGNWYFKCQILKFSCLVVYYWTFNLGEGPFALALTTYIYVCHVYIYLFIHQYIRTSCSIVYRRCLRPFKPDKRTLTLLLILLVQQAHPQRHHSTPTGSEQKFYAPLVQKIQVANFHNFDQNLLDRISHKNVWRVNDVRCL